MTTYVKPSIERTPYGIDLTLARYGVEFNERYSAQIIGELSEDDLRTIRRVISEFLGEI